MGTLNPYRELVAEISPTEFEKLCLEILKGYAEAENLSDFSIQHNVSIPAGDGTYQIDVYAKFVAMGVEFMVITECKRYSYPVSREKVAVLADKVKSLGAHKGIMISTCGFQSGAYEYAKKHGIALLQVIDGNMPRNIGYMSLGNRDLIGICMRMALVEAMYDERKPFLILDDPFVNLDENRTRGAIRFLSEIAKEYQVIYFTCHSSRE